MPLEKPKDEECGNCYHCVSKLGSYSQEYFFCCRYPINRKIEYDNWCGEWRKRG